MYRLENIISDPNVFDDSWLPHKLPHRNREQTELAHALQPILDGESGKDVLISGSRGVGKTVVTRYTLQRLREHAGLEWAFVQCMGKTTAGIIRATLRKLGGDPAQNTPLEDMCLGLGEQVTEPTVVVLDEADDVPETEALLRLWDHEQLSVITICHDREKWLARASDKAKHRFRYGVDLRLERYRLNELVDILKARADRGLRGDAVTTEHLEAIANEAAGKARFGITALHAAATIADERRHQTIVDEDIQDGFERAREWIRRWNLSSLSFHHHVLYETIRRVGEIPPEELHETYEAVADGVYAGKHVSPLSTKRSRRYKLEKLQQYDLVAFEGKNQFDDVYRPKDREIVSELDLNLNLQMVG